MTQSDWIPCSERMPESPDTPIGPMVLVYNPSEDRWFPAYFVSNENRWYTNDLYSYDASKISHWLPIARPGCKQAPQ
jgi:hypothetical protein